MLNLFDVDALLESASTEMCDIKGCINDAVDMLKFTDGQRNNSVLLCAECKARSLKEPPMIAAYVSIGDELVFCSAWWRK